MSHARVETGRWKAGYVVEFDDEGPPEGQVLFVGTREECEAFRDNPAFCGVSYSGPRPVREAYATVWPEMTETAESGAKALEPIEAIEQRPEAN